MGYEADTEVTALYLNSTYSVSTGTCLEEMGNT